jgi:hypothetical protein
MVRTVQPVAAPFDSDWLDQMVKKLQAELESQLNRVRDAKPEKDSAKARAEDARTLSALERTLERLAKLERERAMVRETKIQKHDEGARAALERRLDELAAAETARKRS